MKYKLMRWVVLGFFSVLNLQPLQAQESRTLTLKEAIDLSITNSKQLKLNKEKILEASAAVKEANERRLPEAGVSTSYMYIPFNPVIDLKTGGPNTEGFGVNQVIFGSANVSVPLYSGGKLKYGIESAKYLEQAVK